MTAAHADAVPAFPHHITPMALGQGAPAELAVRVRSAMSVAPRWYLRFCLAAEYHRRGEVSVRAVTEQGADDQPSLGSVAISYGCIYQPFEIPLDTSCLAGRPVGETLLCRFSFRSGEATRDGADASDFALPPAWIIADDEHGGCFRPIIYSEETSDSPPAHDQRAAHRQMTPTLRSETAMHTLLSATCSPLSLQPFNWLEGCVLDGIGDLMKAVADPARRDEDHTDLQRFPVERALRFHIGCYFQPGGSLRYIGAGSEPRHNEILGIEALLPFAALFRHNIEHAAIPLFPECIERLYGEDGLVIDRHWDPEGIRREPPRVSIEGCYTVAYPLALFGTYQTDSRWDHIAEAQISRRLDYLLRDGTVYQRSFLDGEPMQPDWARALCWYLLGTVKTVAVLKPRHDCESLIGTWRRIAERVAAQQRADGLFSTYLGEPESGPDTSGSAGIAAALALGVRHGLLPADYRSAAERALGGLVPFIRPDGLLTGVAQLNRGGDEYQRTGPKVIGQFAMGLAAQLWAARG